MIKRILVPLDGSRFGTAALKYAQEIAEKFGSEIMILQVIKPAVPITPTGVAEPVVQSPAATEAAVEIALDEDKRHASKAGRYLSRKVRDLKNKGIAASYKVMVGHPAESIMAFSKKGKADMIIMTTHGKSGFVRAVMGSVADEVVRKSGKPVLVIRPNSRKK